MIKMNIKIKTKISNLKTKLSIIQINKLSFYKNNLLVDLIDKLYASSSCHLSIKAGSDQLHLMTCYVQITEKIDKQNFRNADFNSKYYKILQLFSLK